MKEIKKIAIIGAGGVTCHLLPILSLDHDIVLVDADSFEPGNSTRQFPALQSTGNKAETLASMQEGRHTHIIDTIPKYLEGNSIVNDPKWKDIDLIIGAVDNNASRRLIYEVCDIEDIPGIICGNETEMGEAHLILPGDYSPFDHHDFIDGEPAPFSCTADENAASAPQTSAANFLAAAACIHILMNWRRTQNVKNLTVHSLLDSRGQSNRTRLSEVV